jgi:hypothetical protein
MTAMLSVKKAVQRNKQEMIAYGVFAVFVIVAGCGWTNFKLSSYLSLASALQALGFCFVLMQMQSRRDVSGISVYSLLMYVIAVGLRVFATFMYKGYQPLDASGQNGLYHTCETVELVLAVVAAVMVFRTQRRECTPADESPSMMLVLLTVCTVMAPLTHSKLNNNKVGDITWILGLYIETVCLLPQLYLLQKRGGEVESIHGHYIASMFVARLVTLRFWYEVYIELKPKDSDTNLPGHCVIAAQLMQVVFLADFMWLYYKSVRYSKALIIEI